MEPYRQEYVGLTGLLSFMPYIDMTNTTVLFVVSTLLMGCANSANRTSEEQACIKGQLANYFGQLSTGNAHVEVNYFPIKARIPYGFRCLDPGTHRLLVSAARGPGVGVNTVILVNLDAGHDYTISANFDSGIYEFEVLDLHDGKVRHSFELLEGYYGFNVLENRVIGEPIDLTVDESDMFSKDHKPDG